MFRSKSDGTRRLILNFKTINEILEYKHFKMVTVHAVADLIQPHCCMITIALKDANYSVKISEEDSKYLKFYAGKIFSNLLCCQMDCLQVHKSLQSSLNQSLHDYK